MCLTSPWIVALLASCSSSEPAPASRHPCADATRACDGVVRVPLDWRAPEGETIEIAFRRVPRRDQSAPSLGTLVGAQGGPAAGLDGYERVWPEIFGETLDRRDLVVMEYRGFGRSAPLFCEGLTGFEDLSVVAACAAALGPRATAFGTAAAVQDLRAVLDALGVDVIDLVGQSYGTYFSQAFAVRYPERVRTLTLDGVMPAEWDTPEVKWASMRRYVTEVCAATPGCSTSDAEVRALVDEAAAKARAGEGGVDLAALHYLVQSNTHPLVARELLPALRVYVAGDSAPVSRLVASLARWVDTFTEGGPTTDVEAAGLYSYWCNDLPLPYPRSADRAARTEAFSRQLADESFRARHAPFPPELVRELPNGQRFYTEDELCTAWPPDAAHEPPFPPDVSYPSMPVLLISGTDDETTPVEGARRVAMRFSGATHVVVPFGDHFASFADPCVAGIVQRFIATGASPGSTHGCAGPSVVGLRRYPRNLGALAPAPVDEGASDDEARLLRAIALTVTDAAARRTANNQVGAALTETAGVRGGRARYLDREDGPTTITLDRYALVDDVTLSGELERAASGELTGRVQVGWPGGSPAVAGVRYEPLERGVAATAHLELSFGARTVTTTLPAWVDPNP